jgi:DNA-binding NtrC family response regulator
MMRSLAISSHANETPSDRPLCLIVEDQALIGMAIEACLDDAGYEAAGPFCSKADALAWLDRQTPEVAILDYVLKDGACIELAGALRQRGVPFLIYSGYSPGAEVPTELRDAPWIEKPCAREDMLATLRSLA